MCVIQSLSLVQMSHEEFIHDYYQHMKRVNNDLKNCKLVMDLDSFLQRWKAFASTHYYRIVQGLRNVTLKNLNPTEKQS